MGVTPSSAAARSMPSLADWLNDLSFQPPSSEMRQGRKSLLSGAGAAVPSPESGAVPQPARATRRPAAAATPVNFLAVEMVNSRLLLKGPRGFRGRLHHVTECYDRNAEPGGRSRP